MATEKLTTTNERINEYLKEKGITKVSVARRIGVSPQVFNGWMHNKNRTIGHEYYVKICEVLEKPTTFFD